MPRSEESQHAYNVERRVRRAIATVDPRLTLTNGDGELFEGPALTVAYYREELREHGTWWIVHDESIPDGEQRDRITELFRLLEGRGLPVKYGDPSTGVSYPCIEVALDPEFHQDMMTYLAKAVYEHGEDAVRPIVRRLGIHL